MKPISAQLIFTFSTFSQIIFQLTSAFGPPKLHENIGGNIWFQIDMVDPSSNKLTLRCGADGNPEKFEWFKDGQPLAVDGQRIVWQKPAQSGSIVISNPDSTDQGSYQCFASNIFGTAVSNKQIVRLGVLDHFAPKVMQRLIVDEGQSLSIRCDLPYGLPPPIVFWLYRDSQHSSIIETIRQPHIATDTDGTLHFTSIQRNDARPNLVYQCAATSPVLSSEYRAGNEFQLILRSPSKSDNQTMLHKLWFSPGQITVKADSRLKLMCIFGGRPLPETVWSKVGGELPLSRIKDLTSQEADFGKSLIIDRVRPEDAGIYECRSRHLFHQMNVSVTAAPFWEGNSPRDVVQPEEGSAEIHCMASGVPTPIIQWFVNGRPLYELVENERRMILDGGRILRIVRLDHDVDTAVYQCNASNSFGYVFGNAFINVLAHAPRFQMPDRRVWNAVRKSNVHMSCEVDAAPEADVRWVDANDHPVAAYPGKIHIFANHTLRISQVNSGDEGLYYCNVSNKYGINRAFNKLQVFSPTHFVRVPAPKKSIVEAHENLEYFCEAVCDPRLTVSYTWTHNAVPINESEHFRLENNSLLILDARGRHSGTIECIALTDVDVKMSGIELIVLDVPDAPIVTGIDCNQRRAMIRWRRPNDHGDPIVVFLVQMHTEFEEGLWQTVVEEEITELDFYQADVTLSPWVNYTFRVIAKNSHGESEPGYLDGVVCSTKPSYPYGNPTEVRAEGSEPNNMVIEWRQMHKYDWNGPGLRYIVRYRLNDPGTQWTEIQINDPLANHTIVRDLPVFRQYLIQVEAINSIGRAIVKPSNMIGYSGEDVPLTSSEEFNVIDFINCTTVILGWLPVNLTTVRGHFKGYAIDYWEEEKRYTLQNVIVGKNSTTATLLSLKPMTNYTATIRTANRRYLSESPSMIKFTTPEGVPSKVHNMRVRAVGARSIFVTWEPPRQPNGYVRGYFITFENSVNGLVEETYVLNRQLYYLYEEAEPDTGYKVSLWAETNGGEGPKVVRPVRTWIIREPDIPMLIVEATSATAVEVQWLPSNGTEWAMPGSTFSVNYSVANRDEWLVSEQISLPRSDIQLDGLDEDTEYDVVGVAKEGKLFRASDIHKVRTLSRATITHISHESLQTAAWFIAVLCAVLLAMFTAALMCCCERQRSGNYMVKRKELERGHQIDTDERQNFLEYQYAFK